MPLQKLQFKPGFIQDVTDYTSEGGWRTGDKVRFTMGFPETIGGWARFTTATMLGTCRDLHVFSTLTGTNFVAAGTNLKLYIIEGSDPIDVTPIRNTTSTGDVTFGATNGSAVITVTDTAHGAILNDFVTFSGAASLGGLITAAVLNQEYQVTSVVDNNSYTITATATANSSDTGNGGSSTVGAYQINTGLNTVSSGSGWGAGPYSRGTWGSAADTSVVGSQLRLWSMDNFGEDLLSNVRGGGIYYWDSSSGTGTRAVDITTIGGAASPPQVANIVLVSERDRHALAFGCDPQGDPGNQDPLTIRFSNQGSVSDWAATATNTAGELRIGTGTEIIAAVQTKQQIVVITDRSVSAMQFIGTPFTFGITEVSTNTSIISQNSAIAFGDFVFWMGDRVFYQYDGNVKIIPCPIQEYIFDNINIDQLSKVVSANNSKFNEVWWFYPSLGSDNNDSYVVYNYSDGTWYFGTLDRTAWTEHGSSGYPLAASPDGYVYAHEFGMSDGSTNPPSPINGYIESSSFDLGEGDRFMAIRRIIPDVGFRASTGSPTATFTLNAKDYPGGGVEQTESGNATRTSASPVEKFTSQIDVRLRGRSVSLKVESNEVGTQWRLGSPRVDIRPDGRR